MERRRLMGKQFAYIVYSITNVNKKYGNSSFVNPLSMSGDGTVTYTSNNTAVAIIDNNGNVTIVAPGEATITATVEDTLDFEYENNSASYTLIVAKADGNVSEPPTPKTIVYDGDDHQLINAGIGTGTMLYKFDYDEEWDEIIPIASEFGTYTIQYKSSENQYYTESSIGTVDVIIQKAQSQYTAPTPVLPLVYNTKAQNLLNEGSTNDGLIWYSTDEINWSTNVPQGTNAGEYRVYWKLVGDYNHTDISSTLITVEMNKVTPTVTPPIGLTIYYDGDSHELITEGSTDYGTLKYSLDGVTYSTSIPTASAMDDYIIYWMVEGNSNVNDIEPATVQTSISGIIVQNPTINLEYNQIDYDGTAKQPSVEVLDDDGNIISSSEYTVTYSDNVDAGTATVIITDVTGGTYIINGTKTFKINSIDPTYIAPTAKTGLVYNGDSQLLLNSGSVTTGGTMYYSSDGVTWSENNNYSETNAGTYNTYWKIIGDNNHNNIDSTLIQVIIDKASVCQYTAPTYTSPTYNCNAQNLLNAGSVGCGTMQYSSDNSTWSTTIPQGTNVGTYTSYWKIVGDNNHYGVDSTSIQTTISKCTVVVVVPTAKALTYNGSAQVLANAGSVTSPSCANGMEYSLDNSTWSSSVSSATNGGAYTVYYRVQGDSNINGVSGNIACSIGEKPITATVTVSPTSYDYDGTAKQPTVTVKDGNTTIPSSEYTVTYSNNVNASTNDTKATVTITDKTGGNWNVIGSATFNINKVPPTYTAPTAKSLIYNGNAQVLLNAGSTSHGTIQYSSDGSNWGTTIPSQTNANTSYITYWRLIGDSNHTDISSTSINTTIAKANQSAPTATGASATYGGTATATASGGGHDSIEWSNGNTLTGNAGSSKSTKARWNGNNNYNPSPWSNEVTLSIVKASGSITCATAKSGLTYNLSAQTLVNAASSSTGTVVYHSVLQEPDGTLWLHIAHHNNPAGGLFSSSDSFSSGVYKDANRWLNVHSAVSQLSTFEFLVRQKATTTSAEVKYRWRQNKSPLTATYEDVAPSAVTRITTSGYTDGGYGGLYILNLYSYMVIANTIKGNWFGAFGAWYAFNGGIPGYPNTTVTNGYMDLYVKVDSASINGGWSTVVPAEMDAATYTIACKAQASTNYNESSVCTVNSTISRAKTSSASAANKTYNGTTETNGTAQTGVSGSYVSWSGTTSATNAGSYTAYATPDSNHAWSDGTTGQKTISWTMSRRGQTAPTLNAASAAFHGTATASIKSYGTVANGTAQAPGSIVWENQSRTALGSQNARAYHAATTTNFSASGWSSTVAVTITCVNDQSVSVSRTNRTWNNSAQVLASATSHGCTYYLGFGSSTTSAPSSWGGANSSISATNVGTYYIWYKATKDGNHCNDIGATYSGTAVISKSDNYSITAAPTVKANTYNGKAQTLLQGGSASIAGSFSYSTYTNAATGLTGTWTFTPTDSAHYNSKSGSVSGCYINRAAGWTGFNTTGVSITYSATTTTKTGTGASGTLSVSSSNTSIATVSISGNTITVTRKGYGSATITVTAALATNYNQATSTFSVSCNKASGQITCPIVNTLTYNGSAQQLVRAGSSSTGTVYYNVGSGSYGTGIPTGTIGAYTVHAYAAEATNYYQSSTCTVNVTINKYTPTVILSATSRAYNGSALYATATVSKPSAGKAIAGTIYYGTSAGATTYSVTYSGSSVNLSSISVTNVGSATVYAYFVPNSTCNDVYANSGNIMITLTVSRTTCSGPTVSGRTVAYNRSAQALANVSGNCGTMHYRLGTNGSWTTSIPTATNANTYTVYWYMDASTNYNGKGSSSSPAGSVSTTIKKLDRTASWTSTFTNRAVGTSVISGNIAITYSGEDATITFTTSNTNVLVFIDEDGARSSTYVGDTGYPLVYGGLATGLGSCTITATVAATTNYNAKSITYTCTIIPADIIDLGLPSGTKWADRNVGASKSTDAGTFFKYGITSAYQKSQTRYSGTDSIIGTSRDQARAIWGGTWHLPTKDQITELFNNTNISLVTVNNVKCVKCTCKTNSARYILLPLVGYYDDSSGIFTESGNQMRFWSGTPSDSTHTYIGIVYNTGGGVITDRASGLNVRPIL